MKHTLNDYLSLLERDNLITSVSAGLNREQEISLVSYDSRNVIPGTLFICKGAHFKPEFLAMAKDKGAVAYISLTPYPEVCSTLAHNRALTENGLRLACYLLRETVKNGGHYGFAANIEALKYSINNPFIFIPCGTGNLHMKNVLETFAAIPVYRTAREYSFPALLQAHRELIPRDIDVYLLTAGSDSSYSRLLREMERAGNTVTMVKIPVCEM